MTLLNCRVRLLGSRRFLAFSAFSWVVDALGLPAEATALEDIETAARPRPQRPQENAVASSSLTWTGVAAPGRSLLLVRGKLQKTQHTQPRGCRLLRCISANPF